MFWNPKKEPQGDPSSLGNLLIVTGRCTPAQVEEALRFQSAHPDMMLGGVLVKLGFLTASQLEVAVARQRVSRNGSNGAVRDLADLAMKRSREVTGSYDSALALAEKLK